MTGAPELAAAPFALCLHVGGQECTKFLMLNCTNIKNEKKITEHNKMSLSRDRPHRPVCPCCVICPPSHVKLPAPLIKSVIMKL